MRVQTVRDLGAAVRTARRARGLTQADLANRLRVSRDWVVRLEQGSPRLEAQKVLDALGVLELALDVVAAPSTRPTATTKTRARSAVSGRFVTKGTAKKAPAETGRQAAGAESADPFDFLNDRTS